MTMFRFGCGHVTRDEAIHEATWGARLIYSEIVDMPKGSGTSVVWDRQTPEGEPDTVRLLFPVIDRAIDEFRDVRYLLSSDSRGRLCWRDGRVLVVMSPQGSYGYLYVTAVLERDGHEGETQLAAFEADDSRIPQLGNWPPEVVEARRMKELASAKDGLVWLTRDLRYAEDEVRRAPTPRAATLRRKKVTEAQAKLDEWLARIADLEAALAS
jgi:hypothetical protein